MKTTRKRWTSKEDSTLIAQVKRSPENLKEAFKRTAREIGRTPSACASRWYVVLSKEYKNNPEALCFAVFSKKRYGVNRKNCRIEASVKTNNSVWRSIVNFVKKLV